MAARERRERGAFSVNPVTGELRKAEVKEGMRRDGMLQLSDKYINAARDAGLGTQQGAWAFLALGARARHLAL